MDVSGCPALGVANLSNEFASQTTKPTTACVARPAVSCWRTEASLASCDRTGRALWMSWRRSSGVENYTEKSRSNAASSEAEVFAEHVQTNRPRQPHWHRPHQSLLAGPPVSPQTAFPRAPVSAVLHAQPHWRFRNGHFQSSPKRSYQVHP